ncbi:DUF317 domain-containing protein [Streptomyces sp. SD11]|uniref:DUF317 domain-containing protein n=1 Tax=Streptomyces sp. SD11 TaxID=3452209 RepID=UPI003F8C122C
MPVSERQLAEFADKHAWQVPFDTSPRHLAGPGDARHVTHGLAAAGWTRISDPFGTHMTLAGPDHRHLLEFTPETGSLARWWHISTRLSGRDEPYWNASFGALAPSEVIASMTDALTTPPPTAPPDPWHPVEAAGWLRDAHGAARSADGMCHIEQHRRSESRDTPDWSVYVREPSVNGYPGPLLWHARFRYNTPAHLVDAFLTALTDTAPLQRGKFDQTAHRSALQTASLLSPAQVVTAHTKRITTIAAQTRTTRHPHQPGTSRTPAPPTGAAPLNPAPGGPQRPHLRPAH